MVKTASIFSQLLRFFPKTEFTKIVREYGAEAHAKGFTSWTQFVSMLFCQLAGAGLTDLGLAYLPVGSDDNQPQ